MMDWGKGTPAETANIIQTSVWKHLFSGLDTSAQAFILFDSNQKVLAYNPAAARVAEIIKGKLPRSGDRFSEIFPAALHGLLSDAALAAFSGKPGTKGVNLADHGLSFYFSPFPSTNGSTDFVLLSMVENAPWLGEQQLRQSSDLPADQVKSRAAAMDLANHQLRTKIEDQTVDQLGHQTSQSLFQLIFENMPDPVLIWNKDDLGEVRLSFVNLAAAELAGSTPADLYGLLLDDFFSRSMQFIGLVQTAFASGEIRQTEAEFQSNSQPHPRWVACDCLRISDSYVLNILRDISQLKNRQMLDETNRNQVELLRQAMTAFTSVLNMDQVLHNVLDYLQKLIPYNRVMLFLIDGNDLRIEATSGFSKEADPLGKTIPARNPQYEAINRNRLPLFLPNAREYRPFDVLGELVAGTSWLGVPLIGHGQILGYISMYCDAPAQYNADHIRLAEIFANEASIAIENARLFEQVQLLAVTDELTGFYNRRYFYELVEIELARSRRYHHPTSLILIDVDHFKLVNDRYGHTTGDQVLQEMCAHIRKAVRESDILGRHGGEEFVLLLPETPVERAYEVAERLRQLVAGNPVKIGDIEIGVSVSAGVAALSNTCRDADSLFRCSDVAMYQAKQAGRNQVSVYKE